MRLSVHPDYREYTDFFRSVPERKYTSDKVFCNHRNIVEKIAIDDKAFVIKKFKKPHFFNRIMYTWFRKSKARRAYEYADRLTVNNIETATPVAYIESKRNLLFHTGYFISEYLDYPLYDDTDLLSENEKIKLKDDFLNFTVGMHNKGIIHKDYNPKNILYHKVGDSYHFAIIDINRIEFKNHNLKLCLQAINQLKLPLEELYVFTEKYCNLRNLDINQSMIVLFQNRRYLVQREERKKFFKKIFR